MTPSHHAVVMLFLSAAGLCVGSFLNVCIYRIPLGLDVRRPRSRCPKCSCAIRAYDNIPVLSWILLRGKCRDCQTAISPRYAAVELAVGALFAAVYVIHATLSQLDLSETSGLVSVIAIVLVCSLPMSLVLAILLIRHDRRVSAGTLPIRHGVRGQN